MDATEQLAGTQRRGESVAATVLDTVLTIQIAVAWAGETGEEPRLGWWRTDLASEFGGHDLFRRLLPRTWRWAVLAAVREAARRTDAELRSRDHDPERLISLFHFGFRNDEQLDQRLADLRRAGAEPQVALPSLADIIGPDGCAPFDRARFAGWLQTLGSGESVAAPTGRRLPGEPPQAIERTAGQLAAALVPLAPTYPLPHFQRAGQSAGRRAD